MFWLMIKNCEAKGASSCWDDCMMEWLHDRISWWKDCMIALHTQLLLGFKLLKKVYFHWFSWKLDWRTDRKLIDRRSDLQRIYLLIPSKLSTPPCDADLTKSMDFSCFCQKRDRRIVGRANERTDGPTDGWMKGRTNPLREMHLRRSCFH